jgi:hypothetical protein
VQAAREAEGQAQVRVGVLDDPAEGGSRSYMESIRNSSSQPPLSAL